MSENPMTPYLQHYTVVLLYPDYSTGDYGADVYVTTVEASNPDVAAGMAAQEAYEANIDGIEQPEDFRPILVLGGDVDVISDASSISPDLFEFGVVMMREHHRDVGFENA